MSGLTRKNTLQNLISKPLAFGVLCSFFVSPSILAQTTEVNQVGVQVEQESFGGQGQINEQGSQYVHLLPDIRFYQKWGDPKLHRQELSGKIIGVVPLQGAEKKAIAAPEIFFRQTFEIEGGKINWVLGRKINNWSELDQFWGAGLWQPLVRWDSSRPVDQGLFGLFFEFKRDRYRTLLFASGIHLPDQNPLFEEQGGRITSANRWFREPIPAVAYRERYREIRYDIHTPDASDIVFRNSFAALFSFGEQNRSENSAGGFGKISFADKPANQFHIELDSVQPLGQQEIMTDVYPIVVRHRLYTLEGGYSWGRSALIISSTKEEFEKPKIVESRDQTPLIDARYDGLIFRQDLATIGWPRANLTMSIIRKDEKSNSSDGTMIKGDVEASTQRFLFEEMVGLKLAKSFRLRRQQQVDLQGAYYRSTNDKGDWIQLVGGYLMGAKWKFSVSADMLGVPDQTKSSTSFISRYRGNDRVNAGITYVF